MATQPPLKSLEYCGVRCTEKSLIEIDSGKVMVSIPRQDIHQVTMRHGTQAPHPVVQAVVGFLLLGLGYFPLHHLIHWMQHGGILFTVEAWTLTFPAIGIWLLFTAFRRGYFLEVVKHKGNQRLAFGGKPDRQELERFLDSVEQCYGLKIRRDI